MNASFVTWYPSCRRSDTIAAELGGRSHLIHYLRFKQPIYAPAKYVLQTIATFRRLFKDRPELVLVASPPVFAVMAVWTYGKLTGTPYIIDAHTGVFDDRRWRWANRLSKKFSRKSVLTIVTNEHLRREVEGWGATALVIGDVPVAFPDGPQMSLPEGHNVVVVNTFSQDEPLNEILSAARLLPSVNFHVTGNLSHSRIAITAEAPANVRFTGWISDADYAGLLRAADVVLCLTTHDHTMQRGAYEAMALDKPLITSNWGLLRATFNHGTLHVDNSPSAIAEAVQSALSEQSRLSTEMAQLREERREIFDAKLKCLIDLLHDPGATPPEQRQIS